MDACSPGSKNIHLAAAIGNGLEWFDFAVYGSFAADLGELFLPRADAGLQLFVSFALFAVGYLMRPIGGLVLGPVGDLLGRRTMLVASVVVMGLCSLLIGLLPTSSSWGPWAAYALLGLRMLQGFSLGGEYTGSLTFVFETARPSERGWRAAVNGAGSIAGFVAGAAAAALIYGLLPRPAVLAWGWRLPFLAGAAVAVVGLWLRTVSLPEADVQLAAAAPFRRLAALPRELWHHRLPFLRLMATIAFSTVAFYMLVVFQVQFAISRAPDLAAPFSTATAINQTLGIGLILLAGRLCDRYGTRSCMRWSCLALGMVLMPAYLLMQQATLAGVWLGQLLAIVPLMLICGSYPSLLPGLFPPQLRCTGLSLAYSLVVALVGGTAPLMGSWLLGERGWVLGPALYTLLWLPACLWALKSGRDTMAVERCSGD